MDTQYEVFSNVIKVKFEALCSILFTDLKSLGGGKNPRVIG